jgi:hypothetical protein
MTTNCLLIAGILIDTSQFNSYSELMSSLHSQLRLSKNDPQLNSPKFLIVNRNYDSDQIEDFPFYLTFQVFPFPISNQLLSSNQAGKLLELVNFYKLESPQIPPKYNQIIKSLTSDSDRNLKSGVFTDYCDFDRGYTYYE